MKFIIFAAVLMVLSGMGFALSFQNDSFNDVAFYRLSPSVANIGQDAWITLIIGNNGAAAKTITISEMIGNADFNETGATAVNTTYGTMWLYEWTIDLEAGQNTSVSYWIKPKVPGDYVITPAKVTVDLEESRLKSAVIVVMCDGDDACSPGENYLNCPQDCKTGEKDGICDRMPDQICDPDCMGAEDNDCTRINETIAHQIPDTNAESSAGPDNILLAIGAIALIVVIAIIWLLSKKVVK